MIVPIHKGSACHCGALREAQNASCRWTLTFYITQIHLTVADVTHPSMALVVYPPQTHLPCIIMYTASSPSVFKRLLLSHGAFRYSLVFIRQKHKECKELRKDPSAPVRLLPSQDLRLNKRERKSYCRRRETAAGPAFRGMDEVLVSADGERERTESFLKEREIELGIEIWWDVWDASFRWDVFHKRSRTVVWRCNSLMWACF